jgi:hypothetical protein
LAKGVHLAKSVNSAVVHQLAISLTRLPICFITTLRTYRGRATDNRFILRTPNHGWLAFILCAAALPGEGLASFLVENLAMAKVSRERTLKCRIT